jgi:3-dehydroquinate dehydratase-1
MICVSVTSVKGLNEALQSGAELIELRLDLIREDPSKLIPLIPESVKSIVTCRPGPYSETERFRMLKSGIKLGADYVDMEIETARSELDALLKAAKEAGTRVILSYHDFKRTADREDLESIMIACYEKGGDIAKIATRVNASEDIRNLMSLYDLPGKKVILGMGDLGRITRVLGPYLGAEFTFASLGESDKTAPGQLSVKQLNELFKVINQS